MYTVAISETIREICLSAEKVKYRAKKGDKIMTIESCVQYIDESISAELSEKDKIIIENAIVQYTTDLSMTVIQSSTATFSDIVSRAIMEARK